MPFISFRMSLILFLISARYTPSFTHTHTLTQWDRRALVHTHTFTHDHLHVHTHTHIHLRIVEVKTRWQIRDFLQRNFLSWKKIFTPQSDPISWVGSFWVWGKSPHSHKGPFWAKKIRRQKIKRKIWRLWRFVLISTVASLHLLVSCITTCMISYHCHTHRCHRHCSL